MIRRPLIQALENNQLNDAAALVLLFLKLQNFPLDVSKVIKNTQGKPIFVQLRRVVSGVTPTPTSSPNIQVINRVDGIEQVTQSSYSNFSSQTYTVKDFVADFSDIDDVEFIRLKNNYSNADQLNILNLVHTKAIRSARIELGGNATNSTVNIPIRLFVRSILADLVSVFRLTGNIAPTDCDYVSIAT